MVSLNQASCYHWSQRDDCTDPNRSVGYWQAARIHALLGRANDARRYGELSLGCSKDLAPFFRGYAYEALARAEKVAGNEDAARKFSAQATALAEQVSDTEDKALLVAELATL